MLFLWHRVHFYYGKSRYFCFSVPVTIVCQKHLFGDIREKKGDEICSASREQGCSKAKPPKEEELQIETLKKKKYVKTMWTSAEENQNRHGMVSGEKRNGFMLSEPGFV